MPELERVISIPPLDRRAAVSGVDDAARTARVVWSTGADVPRIDWQTGRKFIERLSLHPTHVRLDRLNSGAPLLNANNADGLADVIGVVEENSVRLLQTEATAVVRFSKREDVEPIFQDVRDKIVRNVSVGYRVHRFEEQARQTSDVPVWLAVDWEPYEISMVPIGADAGASVRSRCALDVHRCLLVGPDAQRADADRGRRLRLAQARG